jgi:hypothetical protein
MRTATIRITAPLTLVLAASPALGQDSRAGGAAFPHGYVSVSSGATFGTDTAAAVAVEYGENLGRHAQAYVTLSYFDDVLSDRTRADLASLGAGLAAVTGSPWRLHGRDRGVAFVAGGKFLVPTGTGARPYVGGGVGAINLKRTVLEDSRGDVTTAVLEDFGFAEGVFDDQGRTTKPIVEGVVGIGIAAGRTYIDVGYRYRRAFHLPTVVAFSQLSAGIGVRF